MIAHVDPGATVAPAAPQLERLDARALLFLVTTRGDRAIAIASITGGETTAHDVDITALLPRLGCPGVDDLAAWATTPRVLTPTDVDVLCYALRLPLPGERPLPPPRPIERTRAEVLRAAVYAEPRSDDVRLVYADYLQEHGQEHGELIALQLARVGNGDPPSERELVLVARHAREIAQPLTPYLRAGFTLRRGFLAACAIDDAPPPEILGSRAWSTVEALETRRYTVLTNPRLAAVRTLATDTACFRRLVREPDARPFETIVGLLDDGLHTGVLGGDPAEWHDLCELGTLGALRTLVLAVPSRDTAHVAALIASPLGAQLDHLELHVDADVDARTWRARFDAGGPRRLVVRTARARANLAIAIERGAPHRLQLDAIGSRGLRHAQRPEVRALLAALGHGLTQIATAVVGERSDQALGHMLRAMFGRVTPAPPTRRWSLWP